MRTDILDRKIYLGDSVYAEVGCWQGQIKLYTDNGLGPTNTLYLEQPELKALVLFFERVSGEKL